MRAAAGPGARTGFFGRAGRDDFDRSLRDDRIAADILILNRIEAEQAGDLLERTDKRLVLTRGPEGVDIIENGARMHVPPHQVIQDSSHGAGDWFCGALAARQSLGDNLLAAERFANAAAALHVSRPEDAPVITADIAAMAGS